jgi:hypothetical protein
MAKLLIGFLFVTTVTIACSTQTTKKMPGDMQLNSINANIETKTDISSSAAKTNERADSTVIIRPIHKYKYQKKYKIK